MAASERKAVRASLAAQWLKLHIAVRGVRVRSLVEELRSHRIQNIKQKQYCKKFDKDSKKKL